LEWLHHLTVCPDPTTLREGPPMAEVETIAPSNLSVNPENPRLGQPNLGQRQTLREIAENQKRKLVNLAKDILENGLDPSSLPIVTPHKSDKGKFTVLEGNRRIAAIKALENPDTFVGVLDSGLLHQLRDLSKQYLENPIDGILCAVVKDAQDAFHWMKLRHTGENQGAGVVPWNSQDVSRFSARTGGLPLDTQALDFLESEGRLTPEERRAVPATSFRRLLSNPEFREKVGISVSKGELKRLGSKAAVGKALAHVAKDLARGDTKTEHIYTVEDRKEYAAKLPASIVVKKTLEVGVSPSSETPEPKKTITKRVARPKLREKLIRTDCVLQFPSGRLADIEDELRRLKIDDYPNAVAVLFRVFFELSVDHHIKKHSLPITERDKLIVKGLAVAADLVARKKLTDMQARPVRKACQKNSLLAPSIPVMHDYVHNPDAFPVPGDLRAYWDNLQPFFVAISGS
jgi:hypothetical protein